MTIPSLTKLLASLSFFACSSLFAAPLVVDVTGVQSYGTSGNAGNTVLTYNVGANATITSIAYNVGLTAFEPSWLSEIAVLFSGSDLGGVQLRPGVADSISGTGTYVGSADLVALGLSFNVGADGILRLEFMDTFDDFVNAADGEWTSGTLTFGINGDDGTAVPEPATTALFGAGLMLMAYAARRRRH